MHVMPHLRRWVTGVIAVAMGIVFIAALAPMMASQETAGVRHRVEIRRFKFVPDRLVAAPGHIVVWVNLDVVPHTVTAQDASWDSQTLEANQAWQLRLTEEMAGGYFCRYHPMMTGHVHVRRN